jgi:hypothetical protein
VSDLRCGYSEYTKDKQSAFDRFLARHYMVCTGAIREHRGGAAPDFYHFDLNAGPGEIMGMKGSPLVFARQAARQRMLTGLWSRGYFFERDARRMAVLRQRVSRFVEEEHPEFQGRFEFVPGDHCETVPKVLAASFRSEGPQVFGLVYSDPKGVVNFPAIREFSRHPRLQKMDILIHLSATTWKRCLHAAHCKESATLDEELARIGKSTIHLRRIATNQQWTFAFCTNMPNYPQLVREGFHNIRSTEGRRTLQIITYRNEDLDQMGVDRSCPLKQMTFF